MAYINAYKHMAYLLVNIIKGYYCFFKDDYIFISHYSVSLFFFCHRFNNLDQKSFMPHNSPHKATWAFWTQINHPSTIKYQTQPLLNVSSFLLSSIFPDYAIISHNSYYSLFRMATPTLNVSHGPPKRNNNMDAILCQRAQVIAILPQISTLKCLPKSRFLHEIVFILVSFWCREVILVEQRWSRHTCGSLCHANKTLD